MIEGLEKAYQKSEEAKERGTTDESSTVVYYFSGDSCFVESGTRGND